MPPIEPAWTIGHLDDDVLAVVAGFDARDVKYWEVSLSLILSDPFERWGTYAERAVPILGFPLVTHKYWITEHISAGGERIFVFTAEYFDWRPVYAVDETAREVGVFAIRDRWVYDPM